MVHACKQGSTLSLLKNKRLVLNFKKPSCDNIVVESHCRLELPIKCVQSLSRYSDLVNINVPHVLLGATVNIETIYVCILLIVSSVLESK